MTYLQNIFLLLIITIACSCNKQTPMQFADNKVVAHRGAWKANNLPQNSIASLKKAIELGCVGSEFDVRMTMDSILIVTHDPDYHGMQIEESTYEELSKVKLSNGEILPTLESFIIAAMTNNATTGLVCEIKPSKDKSKNILMAEKALALVKKHKAEDYILSYISFGYNILRKIEEIQPSAVTQYLDGSKTPSQLEKDGINGLDYHYSKFKYKSSWVDSAKEKGLILNSWTANDEAIIDWLIDLEFDFISTDEPELALQRIQKRPISKGYKLVWADEFNYKGAPDSSKWAFETGFVRNLEKQLYTKDSSNVNVKKGNLRITAIKERLPNPSFVSLDKKSWKQNWQYADYSSGSISTKGLHGWQYGWIEVRAKLPKGRGLWPAFWMLGNNQKEVRWPACGEIDIMEHVGFKPDSIFGTIHTQAYNHMKKTQKGKHVFIDQPYDKYHLFAIEWTPEKIDFLLDGQVYNQVINEHKTTDEWPFDQEFHLKINTAVGGMLGGKKGIDDTQLPSEMLVDYVRVFQKQ